MKSLIKKYDIEFIKHSRYEDEHFLKLLKFIDYLYENDKVSGDIDHEIGVCNDNDLHPDIVTSWCVLINNGKLLCTINTDRNNTVLSVKNDLWIFRNGDRTQM